MAGDDENGRSRSAWSPTPQNTTFRSLVNQFPGGATELFLRGRQSAAAAALTVPVVVLTAVADLNQPGLNNLATGYLVTAAAIFAVILAALTLLAAFVAPSGGVVRDLARLRDIFTACYVVAALAVASTVATALLFVVTGTTGSEAAEAVAAGMATFFFLETMFYVLWLVGFTIRVGLFDAYEQQQISQIGGTGGTT